MTRRGDIAATQRLRSLYLVRAGLAFLWVTLVVSTSGNLDSLAKGLLVSYPVGDALATLVELRSHPDRSSAAALRLNLGISSSAAAAVALSATSDLGTVVKVFGIWAVASGALQSYVALRRRKSVQGQWLMLISGAGSIVGGLAFVGWAGTDVAATQTLAQYSAGGAVFYVIAAAWMSLSLHEQHRESASALK